jgi:hypothetical protein
MFSTQTFVYCTLKLPVLSAVCIQIFCLSKLECALKVRKFSALGDTCVRQKCELAIKNVLNSKTVTFLCLEENPKQCSTPVILNGCAARFARRAAKLSRHCDIEKIIKIVSFNINFQKGTRENKFIFQMIHWLTIKELSN